MLQRYVDDKYGDLLHEDENCKVYNKILNSIWFLS